MISDICGQFFFFLVPPSMIDVARRESREQYEPKRRCAVCKFHKSNAHKSYSWLQIIKGSQSCAEKKGNDSSLYALSSDARVLLENERELVDVVKYPSWATQSIHLPNTYSDYLQWCRGCQKEEGIPTWQGCLGGTCRDDDIRKQVAVSTE